MGGINYIIKNNDISFRLIVDFKRGIINIMYFRKAITQLPKQFTYLPESAHDLRQSTVLSVAIF